MGWCFAFGFGLKPWVRAALVALAVLVLVLFVGALQGCGARDSLSACTELQPATATQKSVWQLPAGQATPAACDSLGNDVVQCSPGIEPCR